MSLGVEWNCGEIHHTQLRISKSSSLTPPPRQATSGRRTSNVSMSVGRPANWAVDSTKATGKSSLPSPSSMVGHFPSVVGELIDKHLHHIDDVLAKPNRLHHTDRAARTVYTPSGCFSASCVRGMPIRRFSFLSQLHLLLTVPGLARRPHRNLGPSR